MMATPTTKRATPAYKRRSQKVQLTAATASAAEAVAQLPHPAGRTGRGVLVYTR
jgi:hypothetical protein